MRRGFTLVEVLVATSLLAVGLAITFATLRGASRATARAELIAQRDEQLRAVQGFLRTQVNAALPIAYQFNTDTGEANFLLGSADKLEFVALMPGYLSRGGPYLQTLEFTEGKQGRKLVFTFQLLTADGAKDAEREPVVLLDGIAEGEFKFRTLAQAGGPGEWRPEWKVSAQLPPLVGLDIRFTDPARHWPGFVASTRLGVPFGGTVVAPLANDVSAGQP